jgi:putative aminopeptidase FrvX
MPSRFLSAVLDAPTAPLLEERVAHWVRSFSAQHQLPLAQDPHGNLVLTYDGQGGRSEELPLAFLVAMDHPGCELVAVAGDAAEGLWHGDLPTALARDTRVRVHGRQTQATARVVSWTSRETPIGECVDRVLLQLEGRAQVGDLAVLDLPGLRLEGDVVVGRSTLHLVGVAAMLDLLERFVTHRPACRVQLFCVRASTLGFAGTIGLLERGALLPGQCVVAVGGVAAQIGAQPGAGPVVRVGDALSLYDGALLRSLQEAAGRYAASHANVRWQLSHLPLGAADAGVLSLFGRRAGALAVPIENAMNLGRGSDGRLRLEAERFSLTDYLGLVNLLETLAVGWVDNDAPQRLADDTREWLSSAAHEVLRRMV